MPANQGAEIAGAVCDGNRAHWDWLKWLPHNQHPAAADALGPARMVYRSVSEALAALDALPHALAGAKHLVVITDLDERAGPVAGATTLGVGTGYAGTPLTISGYVFGLRMGFDPRSAPSGLGNLLYANIIRNSIERGFHTYDLGPGYLSGKRRYQTEVKDVVQYCHYAAAAPRAQLLRLRHLVGNFAQWVAGGQVLPRALGGA